MNQIHDIMRDFFDKILAFEQRNWREVEKDVVNVFEVLFLGHEEVTLHSRFISYLLSSNHEYLESFVNRVLGIEKGKFNLDGCIVIPNKENKSEYEEIDILIINENERQAIIIENKIHAGDSFHPNAIDGYKGQLERYYNTITKGRDKNLNECRYKCDEDKTHVFYLTLYRRPSDETIGELLKRGIFDPNEHIVNYHKIQEWLEVCIKKPAEPFFKRIIGQYLSLLKRMTTDNKKVMEITNLIAENEDYWKSAYVFSKYFKDVKWHAIHRFYSKLAKELSGRMPSEETITKVAHYNKNEVLVFEFEYDGATLQIINDAKGFTLRDKNNGRWDYLSDELKKIKFHEFSEKETFRILNNDYRETIVWGIIDDVKKSYKKLSDSIGS